MVAAAGVTCEKAVVNNSPPTGWLTFCSLGMEALLHCSERNITLCRNVPFIQPPVKKLVRGFSRLRRASTAQAEAPFGLPQFALSATRAFVIFEKD